MNVTRDVIYDLLPGYFAGELSTDGKALVEAFFATDPEFARMAERFRKLLAEKRSDGVETTASREKQVFERARSVRTTRDRMYGIAVGYTIGALIALFVGALIPREPMAAGLGPFRPAPAVIALVFGLVAIAGWFGWLLSRYRSTR